jgi:hypothetical protein
VSNESFAPPPARDGPSGVEPRSRPRDAQPDSWEVGVRRLAFGGSEASRLQRSATPAIRDSVSRFVESPFDAPYRLNDRVTVVSETRARVVSRDQNQIEPARKLRAREPKCFAHEPLQTVAPDRIPVLLRNAQTNARRAEIVPLSEDQQVPVTRSDLSVIQAFEFSRPTEMSRLRKWQRGSGHESECLSCFA